MCIRDRYEIRCNSVGFQEGDQVWLFNPKRRRGHSPKLQTNFEGLYTVKKRINDVVYRIQQEGQRKFKVCLLYTSPPFEDYWAGSTKVPQVAEIMVQKRFRKLRRYIHLCNNEDMENSTHRFFKVGSILNMLRNQYLKSKEKNKFSCDETMISLSECHPE